MVTRRTNQQIIWAIIRFAAIDVMYDLFALFKGPTESALRNYKMRSSIFVSISQYSCIAIG